MSQQMSIGERVDEVWPAPEYREKQREAVIAAIQAYEQEDVDVVLLDAPPGFGKSLTLYAIAKLTGQAFYTTPLNTLIDQLAADDYIGDKLITMKGRNNYPCIHPEDSGTPVNQAICQRDSDFECEMKGDCKYYGRKMRALEHPLVVTNFSFLMAESMIPDMVDTKFTDRDILIVDECQNADDFAMSNISFTISEREVPKKVWDNITLPPEKYEDDLDYLADWLREDVLGECQAVMEHLDTLPFKTEQQAQTKEELRNFVGKVGKFLADFKNNDWVAQFDTDIKKNRPNENKWVMKPVEVGRFLDGMLWGRADKLLLASATVPPDSWLSEVGLDDRKIKRIKIPSPFPIENRPIVLGHTVGKMTMNEREETIPKMAQKIMQIADHHEGERGFIHCRSYGIASAFERWYKNNGHRDWWKENCFMQDRSDREGSLDDWINSDKQIFWSINMAEGVDLKEDICRWQVLAKTLYRFMGDKRTKFRVSERGEWDWYNSSAVVQIEQAYGRAVRSKEDEAVFYILDESAKGLMQRNADLFHKWTLEAIVDEKINPDRGI